MKKMLFPLNYKKYILSGNKNVTVRIKKEIGKYMAREIYRAVSYSGKDFGINIKIISVKKIIFGSIKDMVLKEDNLFSLNIPDNEIVEVIKFKVI